MRYVPSGPLAVLIVMPLAAALDALVDADVLAAGAFELELELLPHPAAMSATTTNKPAPKPARYLEILPVVMAFSRLVSSLGPCLDRRLRKDSDPRRILPGPRPAGRARARLSRPGC